MIRAVVDAGVLVSAFIGKAGSPPDQIVRAWHSGQFEMVVSIKLLRELRVVLGRDKFAEQAAGGRAEAYVKIFAESAVLVDDPEDVPAITADPDDDYLFALALAGTANYIISGDRHLTGVRNPSPPVLTPREFASLVRER